MARGSSETRLPQAGPVLLLPKMTTFLWAYSTSPSPTPWPPSHVDFALILRDVNTTSGLLRAALQEDHQTYVSYTLADASQAFAYNERAKACSLIRTLRRLALRPPAS